MEHAELSSSVIFVCHVNFSRRLEAESAAISVLLIYIYKLLSVLYRKSLGPEMSGLLTPTTGLDPYSGF
jgi:hypothetical protein